MDKFSIPLSNGYKLIAERNTGEFDKEMYVGIETPNGTYLQDLAIIRPTYTFKEDDVVFDADRFEVLVFGDHTVDDFTNKFVIELAKDEWTDYMGFSKKENR